LRRMTSALLHGLSPWRDLILSLGRFSAIHHPRPDALSEGSEMRVRGPHAESRPAGDKGREHTDGQDYDAVSSMNPHSRRKPGPTAPPTRRGTSGSRLSPGMRVS
jgi:hypothetical protein